jgi:hypothetical protein
MRDISNMLNFRTAIPPAAGKTDSTPWISAIIDKMGYDSLVYAINIGDIASGTATFAVTMEESDSAAMTGATQVAAIDLVGTLAAAGFNFASDNQARKIGYAGNRRYTRLTITPTANAAAAFVSAVAIMGAPSMAPTPAVPV